MLLRLTGARDILIPYFQFRMAPPDTVKSPMLEEIFRLRYEVYCVERRFLSADDYPDGLEQDGYDACSTQIAAYNEKQLIIGSVRLVQPPRPVRFPFEEHCSVFQYQTLPPQEQSGEISRLVVQKSYRRRRGDSLEGISRDFMDNDSPATVQPHPGGNKRRGDSPLALLVLLCH
jgi:N-acyl amino acid synthase of PEP-CTERM/exosortase system